MSDANTLGDMGDRNFLQMGLVVCTLAWHDDSRTDWSREVSFGTKVALGHVDLLSKGHRCSCSGSRVIDDSVFVQMTPISNYTFPLEF